jgi:hypothetical protein
MPIDVAKALAFLNACTTSHPRVTYGLDKKAPNDASQPGDPAPPGFVQLDCSGFVRAAIRRSTTPKLAAFPDGSVQQHDWVKAQGYPKAAVADGAAQDGKVRIAFLPPNASPEHIGHVVLIHDGQTLESHGHVGPDRRQWTSLPWRTSTEVFELTW